MNSSITLLFFTAEIRPSYAPRQLFGCLPRANHPATTMMSGFHSMTFSGSMQAYAWGSSCATFTPPACRIISSKKTASRGH